MEGRAYLAFLDAVSYTTSDSGALVAITAPADAIVVIDRVSVTQETVSTSEANAILLTRASAAGTAAATPTASPAEVGDAAFGGTVGTGQFSVEPTLTTGLYRAAWNVLSEWVWHPTPEERIVLSPSGIFVVNLENTPGTTQSISCSVAFREIGG